MHEKKSLFLQLSGESASLAKTIPSTKQPMKNKEAGRLVMLEFSHFKPCLDMMEACVGSSHGHESLGRLQILLEVVVAALQDSPLCLVQCRHGCAFVNTLMDVC